MRIIINELKCILQKNATFIILFIIIVLYPIIITSRASRYDGTYEKIKLLNDEGLRLSDRRDFNTAIEHLAGAYHLDPDNRIVRKNLANIYLKYAIELKSTGNQDKAISLLEQASALNANIESVHTLLANLYFEKGDLMGAEKEARIALLSNPKDPYLLKFLGHVDYLMEKYTESLSTYHRLNSMCNIPMDTFDMDKIKREQKLFRSYQKLYAHPFVIYYPDKSYYQQATWIAQSLARTYLKLGDWFSYYPQTEISVYCYPEKEFDNIIHTDCFIIGLYDGKIRIRLNTNEEIQLKKTAAHEYTHHVLACVTNQNIPFWCNEGIAQFVASEWDKMRSKLFDMAIARNNLIDFTAMEDGGQALFDVYDVHLAYMQSYVAIDFLVEEYGKGILKELVNGLKKGNDAESVIKDITLMSYPEFKDSMVAFYKKQRIKEYRKIASNR